MSKLIYFGFEKKRYRWDFEKSWIKIPKLSENQQKTWKLRLWSPISQNLTDIFFFRERLWIRNRQHYLEIYLWYAKSKFNWPSGEKHIIFEAISWIKFFWSKIYARNEMLNYQKWFLASNKISFYDLQNKKMHFLNFSGSKFGK